MIAAIAEGTSSREILKCDTLNCDEEFDNKDELTVHKSYHEYHLKIKDQGMKRLRTLESTYRIEKIACPLADSVVEGCYCFPQLPTKLVCEWADCKMEFLSVEKFYEHVSHHAHRLVDKCYWENCNRVLSRNTKQILKEHLRVHTLQKLLACPYCGNFFSTKIKFDDHFLRHLPMPTFIERPETNPSISSKRDDEFQFNIETHEIDGNKINVYRCTQDCCDKAFFTSSLLREHIRLHSNKNQCDLCSYVAKSLSQLESHKLYRHQSTRNFECAICSKTFKQRGDLRAHVRRHQIVEPFKCDKCPFETSNEEGLNTHTKLHSSNHDYFCHICRRVFTRGNNLSRHLKIIHNVPLPDGQSRFKFRLIDEGVYLLDAGDNPIPARIEDDQPTPLIVRNPSFRDDDDD